MERVVEILDNKPTMLLAAKKTPYYCRVERFLLREYEFQMLLPHTYLGDSIILQKKRCHKAVHIGAEVV